MQMLEATAANEWQSQTHRAADILGIDGVVLVIRVGSDAQVQVAIRCPEHIEQKTSAIITAEQEVTVLAV